MFTGKWAGSKGQRDKIVEFLDGHHTVERGAVNGCDERALAGT
jgi:hypothetical protein